MLIPSDYCSFNIYVAHPIHILLIQYIYCSFNIFIAHSLYLSLNLIIAQLYISLQNVPVGSSIFIDNYFSSTKLIQKLTQLGYRVTFTLRSNWLQNCPISTEKQFEKKKRGHYEYFISDNNRCIVIAWKDSKRVLLGSNHIGVEPITTLQRWDKETRCKVDVNAPQIISQYNKHIGGVDAMDMLVALHPIPFRSKRWHFRVIWRILDIMIINSWIIMNSCRNGTNRRSFRLLHFKSEVARYLLQKPKLQMLQSVPFGIILDVGESDEENQPPIKKKREAAFNVSRLTRYDGFNHWPVFVSALNNTRCKNDNCSGKAYWKCSKCNVHLCFISNKNCFTQYYTEK